MLGFVKMGADVQEYIRDLSETDFVVFAGAGVAGENGANSSWRRLLQAFKEKEDFVVSEDVSQVGESEYPDVAQRIYDRLREAGKQERYHQILREELRRKRSRWSAEEYQIVDTARHVITTNFDDGFECALNQMLEEREEATRAVQSLPDLNLDPFWQDYSVSYLHGRVNERCVVFRTDEYRAFYPSQFGNNCGCDNLERFLRDIYEKRTIIFVGFSFADRYVLGAIQKIHRDIKRNDEVSQTMKPLYKARLDGIQHYVCLREFDEERETGEMMAKSEYSEQEVERMVEEKRRRNCELAVALESIKLKVLWYKEHIDWTEWFEDIRRLRRSSRNVIQ